MFESISTLNILPLNSPSFPSIVGNGIVQSLRRFLKMGKKKKKEKPLRSLDAQFSSELEGKLLSDYDERSN